jgi:hypothetical protein
LPFAFAFAIDSLSDFSLLLRDAIDMIIIFIFTFLSMPASFDIFL